MKRIIAHHVPKTGMTYVLKALEQAGYTHKRVPWAHEVTGREAIQGSPDATLFSSHHAFAPDRFTPVEGELWITWVRHPVDMVYSAYAYYREHPGVLRNVRPRYLYDRIAEHDTLEGYVDAVLASDRPFFPEGAFSTLGLEPYHGGGSVVFDFVGCAERMGPDVADLASVLGVEVPLPPRLVNATGAAKTYRREELEKRLRPEIEAVAPWFEAPAEPLMGGGAPWQ